MYTCNFTLVTDLADLQNSYPLLTSFLIKNRLTVSVILVNNLVAEDITSSSDVDLSSLFDKLSDYVIVTDQPLEEHSEESDTKFWLLLDSGFQVARKFFSCPIEEDLLVYANDVSRALV